VRVRRSGRIGVGKSSKKLDRTDTMAKESGGEEGGHREKTEDGGGKREKERTKLIIREEERGSVG
jgi:hypothetical protein